MRADAVRTAAAFDDSSSVSAALHDPDKRVRLAAAGAAADLKTAGARVVFALKAMTSDADPTVVQTALASLGALKAPGAYAILVAALNRPSFRAAVASGAVTGLAAYGDARAFPLITARIAYGTPENERNAAIRALARLAAHTKRTGLALSTLLDLVEHDPLIQTRDAAARALGALGDPRAIPVLQRVQRNDSQQDVQENAWNAILDIRDAQNMAAYERRHGKHRK